jgi:hypothetical protein
LLGAQVERRAPDLSSTRLGPVVVDPTFEDLRDPEIQDLYVVQFAIDVGDEDVVG